MASRGRGRGQAATPQMAANQMMQQHGPPHMQQQQQQRFGQANPQQMRGGHFRMQQPPQQHQQQLEVLSRQKLQQLVNQINPNEKLDPDVEEVLLEIADDFIESVTTFACSLAKHRKSTSLEVKDLQLHLDRNWNIRIPGFSGAEDMKPFKKPQVVEAHKQRLQMIRKTQHSGSSSGPASKVQRTN